MSRRSWLLLSAVAIVAISGLLFARRGDGGIEVDTDLVARPALLRSTVTASGEIVATRYADIGSSVMGKIVGLPVKEGDGVQAGQVLARIDAVQAQSEVASADALVGALEADERASAEQGKSAAAELQAAEAALRDASQTLARRRELWQRGLVSQAELDAATAAAESAAARVSAARAQVSAAAEARAAAGRRIAQARAQRVRAGDVFAKTSVVSPIDGIVSRLRVREGEMVVVGIQNQPGTTLMTISDLGQIDAEVKVAEADVLRVALGQPASVTLEAVSGAAFAGRVVEIGASALPVTTAGASAREFKVVVRLDKPSSGLRPGLTCDAEIVTSEKREVLTVPLQSVVLRRGPDGVDGSGVFAVRGGRAVFVPVTTGVIGGLRIEVAGVNEGDQIIVGPYQVLRDLRTTRQCGRGVPRRAMRLRTAATMWREGFGEASQDLIRNPLRASLSALAMAVAVGTTTLVQTGLDGLSRSAERTSARAFGSNSFLLTRLAAGSLGRRELADKQQRNQAITRSDVRFLDGVAGQRVVYAATAQRSADVTIGGRTFENATVSGTQSTLPDVRDIGLARGRFFTRAEEADAAQVCVLGHDVVTTLFPGNDPIGHTVRIGLRGFTVIGIQEAQGSAGGQSLDRFVWMPLLAFDRTFGAPPSLQVFAAAGGEASTGQAEDHARISMRARRHLQPGAPDSFDIVTPEASRSFVERITAQVSAAGPPIAFIALLAAVVVVANTTLVSVTERTREIGVRRAVGARRSSMLIETLAESCLVAVAGGAAGLAFAGVTARVAGSVAGLPLAVEWPVALGSLAAAAASGVLAGWYPARRAASLDIIDALRQE